MAIPAPLAEFILAEHQFRPLSGNILSLGRQTILFDENVLDRLLDGRSIPRLSKDAQIDEKTTEARQSPEMNFITDDSFYRSFSKARYDVLDVSDYEGATIIDDLCKPLPPELAGRFDFIFNGSVLDNIFDPAAALRNISLMLKPNGRVIHIEMASNLAFEYLIYSPDWLVAEKNAESTWDRSPIQWCYRGHERMQEFQQSIGKFDVQRPLTTFGSHVAGILQPSGGYVDCGVTMSARG